jgi:ssDNA-binding Zn-finger/Zn-ribbon topoisomerase 1
MPWEKERYPSDWNERAKARKEQAGWACEQCGAKQGEERWGKLKKRSYTVWLAAAHLNHDPENPHARLTVFCQACHLKYDSSLHWRTRYQRRRARMLQAGQLPLFEDEE